MRTRSEEPYRANCCARYPLPEGVGEYMVSSVLLCGAVGYSTRGATLYAVAFQIEAARR